MRRLAIFAHYDEEHEIRPYIVFFLERLREVCSEIVFVSNCRLQEGHWRVVRDLSIATLAGTGDGYDFGMWQLALQGLDLGAVDELVLTNSSIYGPIFPLVQAFDKMSQSPCDFWAMTESWEIAWHLQSYFLVFRKKILQSGVVADFFRSVLPYRDKPQLIRSYEVGLSIFLRERGFGPAALIPGSAIPKKAWSRPRKNPTLWKPIELLSLGMPFVKVALLRDNPGGVSLRRVHAALKNAGYDLALTRTGAVGR